MTKFSKKFNNLYYNPRIDFHVDMGHTHRDDYGIMEELLHKGTQHYVGTLITYDDYSSDVVDYTDRLQEYEQEYTQDSFLNCTLRPYYD